MQTAKIFTNGKSQAVRLPKEFRFSNSEVGIRKMGDIVYLFPHEKESELFFSSLGKFDDDVFEAIQDARASEAPPSPRASL